MPYELESKKVEICGETLTVYQASNAMDVERSNLISEARAQGANSEDTKDQYMYYVQTLLYPSLVACTKGNIPTTDQFMNDIPYEESDKWIETARQLNPRWFRFLMPEESVEKKEEPQTSSTPA